jgi:phosphoribosylglycinamide formyltransferase-1
MSSRIVILASGDGSLAQSIIDACEGGKLPATIVAVISDRLRANVITRGKIAGIPTFVQVMAHDRTEWDTKLFSLVNSLNPDLVVCAGFMRILSPEFVNHFKTINSHPALLPLFPGSHAVFDTLRAGVKVTGTTVHWVDAGLDTGEIIRQVEVRILPDDDVASLHERIKIVERSLIVATIQELLTTLESRNV